MSFLHKHLGAIVVAIFVLAAIYQVAIFVGLGWVVSLLAP
jgi:hypothetical protein